MPGPLLALRPCTPDMAHQAEPGDITQLLQAAADGDREAFAAVVARVYGELTALAHQRIRHEAVGHTLGTTGLVHEAYLKLARQSGSAWQNREQFFAVCSEAMRRILVDHARRRQRGKRGGRLEHVPLEDALDADALLVHDDVQAAEVLALDQALRELAAFNPEGARIVELRFFGGLTNDEIAMVTGSSERTVRRQWSVARAWLRRAIPREADPQEP